MFRISVCYGQPDDEKAFDDHYANIHTPLVAKIPGLKAFTTGKSRSLMPDRAAPYYMVASLEFDTAAELKAALKSPEMSAASTDVAKFATGGATLYSAEVINHL